MNEFLVIPYRGDRWLLVLTQCACSIFQSKQAAIDAGKKALRKVVR
jgi:hypothetical protein